MTLFFLIIANTSQQRKEIYDIVQDIARREDGPAKANKKLKSYELEMLCPWLASFQWYSGIDSELEIPGQYHGHTRPQLEKHVKIVKFGTTLQVFTSLRAPMALTIHGSDGKVYRFIVKYGEDLRQDERVQQLLSIMNSKLLEDKNCRQHNLEVMTYKVIPISQHFGLLEMVPDCIELKDLCSDSLQKQGKGSFESLISILVANYNEKFHERSKYLLITFKPVDPRS